MHRIPVAMLALLLSLALLTSAPGADEAVKAVNIEKVNTAGDESDPYVTPDGMMLIYSQRPADGRWDFFASTHRTARSDWGDGKPLLDVNTMVDDRSCSMGTTNGRYPYFLYFATKKDERINNYDIYMSVKQGPRADFTSPTPVNPVCTEADELFPWVTADGREMYFSRKEKEGWRLYVATRPGGSGAFLNPQPVEFPIDFHHATVSASGRTMILEGPLEKKRWGLFRSNRTSPREPWSKPEPIDALNDSGGATGDHAPCLSRDSSVLYFSSDRSGGKGGLDLWAVTTTVLRGN